MSKVAGTGDPVPRLTLEYGYEFLHRDDVVVCVSRS